MDRMTRRKETPQRDIGKKDKCCPGLCPMNTHELPEASRRASSVTKASGIAYTRSVYLRENKKNKTMHIVLELRHWIFISKHVVCSHHTAISWHPLI